MSYLPRFRRALVWLPVLTISAVAALLATPASTWSGWRPATCLPADCFCEAPGTGPLRQPINTWSNLAFVIVGWLIAAHATPDRPLRRSYALILAGACVAIGLGSMLYHASLSFVGQWFDVMSMYLLGTFMVWYAAARLRPIGDRAFTIGYLFLNVVLGGLLIVWPEARRYLFGALIVVALLLEASIHRTQRPAIQARWLIGALAVYVVAQIIWTLDLNHIVCDPTSVVQGHAVWHVLTAVSAGLLYGYYQSDLSVKG